MKSKMVFYFLLVITLFLSGCAFAPATSTTETIAAQIFVIPGPTEKRLISEEQIPQSNCNGSSEISQTIKKDHTVIYALELGTGITVSADGSVSIPKLGKVGVGAEVASNYKVSYGQSETISRSITVAAKEGTNIQHTIRQYEILETGEVLIIVGDQSEQLKYSFPRDFSIEQLEPANIGCPATSGDSDDSSTISPTTQPEPPGNTNQNSDNLLKNPGFELEINSWETSGQINIIDGYVGNYAIESLRPPGGGGWIGINQETPVVGGKKYAFTAYLNWTDVTQLHMKIVWLGSNREILDEVQVMAGVDGSSNGWVQRGGSATAPENAVNAIVFIWHGVLSEQVVPNGTVQIDDVVFTQLP